jgi:dTMP kinase
MAGTFITIEGPDGSGKSTILQMLFHYFQEQGYKVMATREPGGIRIAEEIRSIIHDTENTMMDARTEALLYAAARRQHLAEKVMPALQDGYIVLCDRFIDSSLAYQGYARGLGIERVFEINRFATEDCMPHVTIYLDLEPSIGLQRIHKDAGREINRLDLEGIEFHERVRKGYLQLAERFKERITVVDADAPLEEVFENVKKVIEEKLK